MTENLKAADFWLALIKKFHFFYQVIIFYPFPGSDGVYVAVLKLSQKMNVRGVGCPPPPPDF